MTWWRHRAEGKRNGRALKQALEDSGPPEFVHGTDADGKGYLLVRTAEGPVKINATRFEGTAPTGEPDARA